MSKPHTYIALLRGVNVGGKSTVPMSNLRACFERLGYERVSTYINSGNVIFMSPAEDVPAHQANIERALGAQFNLPVRVVIRTLQQIDSVVAALPKNWSDSGLKCNVIFLRPAIDEPSIVKNFTLKAGIEELSYHPGVLFWAAKTSDLTKSAMVKLSRSPLYQDMTVRTKGTVQKLQNLMHATEQGIPVIA